MNNAVSKIENRVERIEKPLLAENSAPASLQAPSISANPFLSAEEAAEFLGIAKQTVYQNVSRIPHYKRHGRLYFKRSELIAYVEEGAVKTQKGGLRHV